jgi:transposase
MFVKIPKQIIDKKINLIQIVPKYDGYKFRLNYTYEKEEITTEKQTILKGDISIDLGMVNLMTIYDPNGKQYIIKGETKNRTEKSDINRLSGNGNVQAIIVPDILM